MMEPLRASLVAHLLGLPDTVTTSNSLLLVLWVRVRVIDDDRVSRLQVETTTSGTDGQQEDEHVCRHTDIAPDKKTGRQ